MLRDFLQFQVFTGLERYFERASRYLLDPNVFAGLERYFERASGNIGCDGRCDGRVKAIYLLRAS